MDGETFDPGTGEIMPAAASMSPAIAAAIIAVMKQVKQLGHDERNQQGGYNSVSVDKMYATLGPIMADAGLALLIDESETNVRANEKTGNPWLFASYDCRFLHESGAISPVMRRSIAMPISGPQAFGAAQSYVEKQLLRQVFKVPTGERDADATAPQEDAPESRSAGRTAQGGAPAATAGHGRPQAAPAPSEAQKAAAGDATKRRNELRTEIQASMTVADAESWKTAPAWAACRAAVINAARLNNNSNPKGLADTFMGELEDMIEKRKAMLLNEAADAGTQGGYS